MANYDEKGAPKSRPVPQDTHINAAQSRDDYNRAVQIVMAKENLPWPKAVEIVERKKVATILAEHNSPELAKPKPEAKSEPKPEAKK